MENFSGSRTSWQAEEADIKTDKVRRAIKQMCLCLFPFHSDVYVYVFMVHHVLHGNDVACAVG